MVNWAFVCNPPLVHNCVMSWNECICMSLLQTWQGPTSGTFTTFMTSFHIRCSCIARAAKSSWHWMHVWTCISCFVWKMSLCYAVYNLLPMSVRTAATCLFIWCFVFSHCLCYGTVAKCSLHLLPNSCFCAKPCGNILIERHQIACTKKFSFQPVCGCFL